MTKKQTIPKKIRQLVWNNYIGESIGKHPCLCCQVTDVTQMNFQCGHIISEYNGGKCTVNNLLPICNLCNTSMGRTNMDVFMKKHGLNMTNINKIMGKNKIDSKANNKDEPKNYTLFGFIKKIFKY